MTHSRRTATDMYPLMEIYLSGAATQKQFSAEHGMSVAVLNYWLAKYRRQSSDTGAFLEIRPVAREPQNPLLEVCYPSGVRLRIFTPLRAAYLDHLLSA